ncbi:uncharacterized protein ACA1_050220, partial [Acanthamoeba castellanii str. Neff]
QPPLPTAATTSTAVSALPGQGQKGGMLESILTLLVEEVRELKKSNQDLHKEVVLLREKQEQTDEKVERITQAAPERLLCHRRHQEALYSDAGPGHEHHARLGHAAVRARDAPDHLRQPRLLLRCPAAAPSTRRQPVLRRVPKRDEQGEWRGRRERSDRRDLHQPHAHRQGAQPQDPSADLLRTRRPDEVARVGLRFDGGALERTRAGDHHVPLAAAVVSRRGGFLHRRRLLDDSDAARPPLPPFLSRAVVISFALFALFVVVVVFVGLTTALGGRGHVVSSSGRDHSAARLLVDDLGRGLPHHPRPLPRRRAIPVDGRGQRERQ